MTTEDYDNIGQWLEAGEAPPESVNLLLKAYSKLVADRDRWQAECESLRTIRAELEQTIAFQLEAHAEQAALAAEYGTVAEMKEASADANRTENNKLHGEVKILKNLLAQEQNLLLAQEREQSRKVLEHIENCLKDYEETRGVRLGVTTSVRAELQRIKP